MFRDYEQGNTPENELQIYTWMDATLGELAQLIKDVNPDARRRGTQFAFAIVAADGSHNHYYIKEIGRTENGQRRMDDQIQLGHKRFHIGDYLDVAISFKRPEPMGGANGRHERTSQYQGDDNQRARYIKERHSDGKPSRTSPKDDHRHHPY